MIFVTVGNSIKGVEFHRLIREMDDIAVILRRRWSHKLVSLKTHPGISVPSVT